ncbi:murein hydrolase activator EnvC family protein [Alkalihalobacillus sp. CinArs1]|uniref:murein hydrolase activator EnvC family protein n=1 Tax=Alkalihalobacillus sp. CinArs1 TaxID=2995314 RepID=UPI0022DCEEE1|nr:M23 family metallopeptidase [Alkalihalobacillus sp. CinArs1]
MKFKVMATALTITLGLSTLSTTVSPAPIQANSLDEKLDDVKDKQSQNADDLKEKESKLEEVKKEQEQVQAEIRRIDQAVAETDNKITTKEKEIEETMSEVEQLKEEIKALEKRIAERDKLLKDRVRSMQQNNGGSVDYMEVLLGASSFGDFVERVLALNTIAEQDKKILEEHKADKLAVEEKKAEVEKKLASLEEKKAELESLKKELSAQKAEKDKLMASLEHEEGELHDHMLDLNETAEILKAQEKAVQQEIKRAEEAARKAAAAREAAAKKAAAEKAAAKKAATSNNSSSSNESTASSEPAPAVSSSSSFRWPTAGRVTSGIGQRWGSFHAGIDIAQGGKNPVYAAADGTVLRSYYSDSYGNVVFLTHSINGQMFTTVYAHMRDLGVSTGQSVSAGTYLGTMGNTGASKGQHLHFEVHKGSWNQSKSNAVNPLNYLP